MIEIIILVILAFFIFKKLKSILGEEYDEQMFGYNAEKKRKIKDAEKIEERDALEDEFNSEEFKNLSSQAKANYKTLCDNIGNFSLSKFKKIVENVITISLKANEDQDKNVIKSLFSKDLANTIIQSFDSENINHTILISIDQLVIVDISKKNNVYSIQIECKTQQINYTTEKVNNTIVDGDKKEILLVNEKWCFSHDINSNNNTWFIEKIEAI